MTIHLPDPLESTILAAVHSGRFASLDDAMTEAASMLVERLEHVQAHPPSASEPDAAAKHKPIWEEFAEIAAGIPDEEFRRPGGQT